MNRRTAVICATGASCLAVAAVPASVMVHAASNGTAPLVHVGLNPSTCGTTRGPDGGVVNVHLDSVQQRFMVNVSVHGAQHNRQYVVDVRCKGQIGTLTTNPQGTGTAHIDQNSSAAPSGAFYIDISVLNGGGGAGNYGDTLIAGPFSVR